MENMFLEGQATQRRTEYLAASGREGKAVAPKAWPAWRFVGNEIGESLEPVRPPEKFHVRKGAGVAGLMELRAASPSPYIRLYGPAPRRAWLCLPRPSPTLEEARFPKEAVQMGRKGTQGTFGIRAPRTPAAQYLEVAATPAAPRGRAGRRRRGETLKKQENSEVCRS